MLTGLNLLLFYFTPPGFGVFPLWHLLLDPFFFPLFPHWDPTFMCIKQLHLNPDNRPWTDHVTDGPGLHVISLTLDLRCFNVILLLCVPTLDHYAQPPTDPELRGGR